MKKPLAILRYLVSVYLFALVFLSLFRFLLYFVNLQEDAGVDNISSLLLRAMMHGVRFDNAVVCYVMILPLAVLMIFALCNKIPKIAVKISNIYFIIILSLLFTLSIANIPYFAHFSNHIGSSVFNWFGVSTGLGEVTKMVYQDSSNYPYLGLIVITIIVLVFFVLYCGKRLMKATTSDLSGKDRKLYIPVTVLIVALCFFGSRGSVFGFPPIKIKNSLFSKNMRFNQLSMNPTFYLMKSTAANFSGVTAISKKMNKDTALQIVRQELGITTLDEKSPLLRTIHAQGEAKDANIVIVLMESMSVRDVVEEKFEGKTITPYLNHLIDKSYYFENFFSAGSHTNNAIVATLYGYPPMFDQPTMGANSTYPDLYSGLPHQLKKQGYETLFFITGNPHFDNMQVFLEENSFGTIYSQKDYPADKVKNGYGVQDDFLLQYGNKRLTEVAKTKKPFIATLLTVSNHGPIVVPEAFKNKGADEVQQIIAFADNSIKEFMESAEKEEWFDNTIFVFLGDHGSGGNWVHGMSIEQNHVPLIIYSPLFDDAPKRFAGFSGQVDIFPTIMGLLNRSYTNNTLGIDLFKEKRSQMFFVNDNNLSCINEEYVYTYNVTTDNEVLFLRKDKKAEDISVKHPATKDSLKNYATTMMVVANHMVTNKLTNK